MDMLELIKISLRRWYVVVPLLVVAWFVANDLAADAKVEYTSDVSLAVVPPATVRPVTVAEGAPELVNPYDRSGGGRLLLASVLERTTSNDAKAWTVKAGGLDTYTAEIGQRTEAITYTVEGEDEAKVKTTAELLARQARVQGRNVQIDAGTHESLLFNVSQLSPVDTPTELPSDATRMRLIVLALGLAAAMAAAVLVEGIVVGVRPLLAAHRAGRARRQAPGTATSAGQTEPRAPRFGGASQYVSRIIGGRAAGRDRSR